MKKILVLGGGGFIGTHLVNRLLLCGYQVRVWDKLHVGWIPCWKKSERVEYLVGDFNDCSTIDDVVRGIDIAYHLMSTTIPETSNQNPIFDIHSNLIGTLSFLNAAVKHRLKKVVFISSGGTIYGTSMTVPIKETDPTNPICSYGINKLAIEKYLGMYKQVHALDYIILRLANPFGEWQRPGAQGFIAAFMQKAIQNIPFEIWGDGTVVRDYIYISDVIETLMRCVEYKGDLNIFNIGSGVGRNLNELVKTLRYVTGRNIKCIYKESRLLDVPSNVLDINRAKQAFDWKPNTNFFIGLKHTWEWFQEFY